ncbi:MAG: galactokinase [Bacilli bacterium]|nr:galactokinase [Bacilli bacterium]
MVNEELIRTEFKSVFKLDDYSLYFSPGRVNLIGEHIDYNGGYVLPIAISLGTYGAVHFRDDNKIRLYSMSFKHLGVLEFSLDNIEYNKANEWCNYVLGVIKTIQLRTANISCGFDLLIYSDLPICSGLSSSASLEDLVAFILNDKFNLGYSLEDIALISKDAENNFNHLSCGIMDQAAISLGKKDHALYLNTSTLEYEYIPFVLKDENLIILSTNKKRELTDSKYNERVEECGKALAILKQEKECPSLCSLSMNEFNNLSNSISDDVLLRRARHCVSENERTKDACSLLKNNDIQSFASLLDASHQSLKDDYEVTGFYLDTMVDCAHKQIGCIGARMTGAGFGGCCIALVKKENTEQFITNVKKEFDELTGLDSTYYVVSASEGPRQL